MYKAVLKMPKINATKVTVYGLSELLDLKILSAKTDSIELPENSDSEGIPPEFWTAVSEAYGHTIANENDLKYTLNVMHKINQLSPLLALMLWLMTVSWLYVAMSLLLEVLMLIVEIVRYKKGKNRKPVVCMVDLSEPMDSSES